MAFYLVVQKSFKHQIDCFCFEKDHHDIFHFHRGDLVEVTRECKFIEGMGWYYLIIINKKYSLFIAVKDLEIFYEESKLFSLLDLELRINFLSFKIDLMLEMREQALFGKYAEELTNLKQLHKEVNRMLGNMEETIECS